MTIIEQIEVIHGERCELYMPHEACKGWKSFCLLFGQRGMCLFCSVVNSVTEYTFVGAFPQCSSPRCSPKRTEVDAPLPIFDQPQLHHRP